MNVQFLLCTVYNTQNEIIFFFIIFFFYLTPPNRILYIRYKPANLPLQCNFLTLKRKFFINFSLRKLSVQNYITKKKSIYISLFLLLTENVFFFYFPYLLIHFYFRYIFAAELITHFHPDSPMHHFFFLLVYFFFLVLVYICN